MTAWYSASLFVPRPKARLTDFTEGPISTTAPAPIGPGLPLQAPSNQTVAWDTAGAAGRALLGCAGPGRTPGSFSRRDRDVAGGGLRREHRLDGRPVEARSRQVDGLAVGVVRGLAAERELGRARVGGGRDIVAVLQAKTEVDGHVAGGGVEVVRTTALRRRGDGDVAGAGVDLEVAEGAIQVDVPRRDVDGQGADDDVLARDVARGRVDLRREGRQVLERDVARGDVQQKVAGVEGAGAHVARGGREREGGAAQRLCGDVAGACRGGQLVGRRGGKAVRDVGVDPSALPELDERGGARLGVVAHARCQVQAVGLHLVVVAEHRLVERGAGVLFGVRVGREDGDDVVVVVRAGHDLDGAGTDADGDDAEAGAAEVVVDGDGARGVGAWQTRGVVARGHGAIIALRGAVAGGGAVGWRAPRDRKSVV